MEPAKNHHHHHHHHLQQDQDVGSSSSSYYGVGTTANAWGTTTTPSFLDTNNGFTTLYQSDQPIVNSRETLHQESNTLLLSQYNAPIGLGFHNWTTNHHSMQDMETKEQLSNHYYHKYTELLTGDGQNLDDINRSVSNCSRGFNPIYPSASVSGLDQIGVANAGGLDVNLEAVDLLTSSSFRGSRVGILRDGFCDYGGFDDHMQRCNGIPFYGSRELSDPVGYGSMEAKRSSTRMEAKAHVENVAKKSRSEGRASCPPFKVRKEKMGDRIATLQQLVAPFGKTDTASVLKEAIGYIKFLQDQIQTLSVPYMKASRKKSTIVVVKGDLVDQNETNDEAKWDLRSRGLCLLPLSCFSYIAEANGGVVWPPPHFGGVA